MSSPAGLANLARCQFASVCLHLEVMGKFCISKEKGVNWQEFSGMTVYQELQQDERLLTGHVTGGYTSGETSGNLRYIWWILFESRQTSNGLRRSSIPLKVGNLPATGETAFYRRGNKVRGRPRESSASLPITVRVRLSQHEAACGYCSGNVCSVVYMRHLSREERRAIRLQTHLRRKSEERRERLRRRRRDYRSPSPFYHRRREEVRRRDSPERNSTRRLRGSHQDSPRRVFSRPHVVIRPSRARARERAKEERRKLLLTTPDLSITFPSPVRLETPREPPKSPEVLELSNSPLSTPSCYKESSPKLVEQSPSSLPSSEAKPEEEQAEEYRGKSEEFASSSPGSDRQKHSGNSGEFQTESVSSVEGEGEILGVSVGARDVSEKLAQERPYRLVEWTEFALPIQGPPREIPLRVASRRTIGVPSALFVDTSPERRHPDSRGETPESPPAYPTSNQRLPLRGRVPFFVTPPLGWGHPAGVGVPQGGHSWRSHL
ncbi:muscle M-line assembly protein unc-89-like [Phlebotomus papatasi]|uniref:muscle M-line assembly protein unc-89-like n=1 Tax=Phlebotomus papatasi TaxID=29031 RepID=UPI0024841D7D|nr:muscle M-line assembly protein unc-89-like [Phlebotomus papatasi]XP_055711096.1 muscle M-line assembly protein unc-89-like [Phlebotomus papatasi]